MSWCFAIFICINIGPLNWIIGSTKRKLAYFYVIRNKFLIQVKTFYGVLPLVTVKTVKYVNSQSILRNFGQVKIEFSEKGMTKNVYIKEEVRLLLSGL
jgi:hypothetical protein